MERIAYLSLGSNRGDSRAILEGALRELSSLLGSLRVSPIYRSSPLYVTDQADYLNCAASGSSYLEPEALLDAVQRIEAKFGRDRSRERRRGERTLDIDLALYGNLVLSTPRLSLPHPFMLERKFVLLPLVWLEPSLRHPATGIPLAESLAKLGEQGIYYSEIGGYSCLRHDE